MASTPTLASIAADAQTLFSEISSKGVNVADPKELTRAAKALLAVLDNLQPHLNTAQNALGGQEAVIAQANDLRNKLNRIVSAYGGA